MFLRNGARIYLRTIRAENNPESQSMIRLRMSQENKMTAEPLEKRAGRPRAIPERLIPKVLTLYQEGMGYRAVARELRQEGVSVDWSTVRRVIKTHQGLVPRRE